MRVYVGVFLVQVSLDSFWSAGFGTFLKVSALLLPIGGMYKLYAKTPEENGNTAPTTYSAIQAASQSIFISAQLYCS
jgi:hypothetical protein